MKLKSILAGVILSMSFFALGDDLFEYHTMTISKGAVTPGVWNSDFEKAKEYAEQTGSPLIVFWGNASCGHCNTTERYISGDKTLDKWLKDNQIVLAIGMGVGGAGNETNFKNSDAAKSYARQGHSAYPYIRYHWVDANGKEHNASSQNTVSSATILSTAKATFAGWVPSGACGSFSAPDEECNRLEYEDATPSVEVVLERTGKTAEQATNAWLYAYGPDNKTVFFKSNIVWKAGDESQAVTVPVQDSGCKASGDKITLALADASGKRTDRSPVNHITYVTGSGDSASNPLWIGERSVPAAKGLLTAAPAQPLAFGEWTMDLDVATQMVAQTEGAYTLVSIQGSLWCPDCANTDRNFLDVTNELGQSRFKIWAEENKLALVTIDIPNFGKAYKENPKDKEDSHDVEGKLTPCLLKRDAIETTLARNTYTNKSGKTATYTEKDYKNKRIFDCETPLLTGANPSDTAAKKRSGLGYLTRKGVSDADAKKILDRNHFLAASDTALGGFHRPEDGNAYRTGVPIFVLLRRDGTVVGRFTAFAAKSPFTTDQANFGAYTKRIRELISEDKQTDNGEIENNDARTTGLTLAAAGQTTGTGGTSAYCISHADAIDVFKLIGTAPGVRQGIRLSAPLAEVNDKGVVTLELQKMGENGKPTVVTKASGRKTVNVSVTGLLKDGLNLDYTFGDDDTYYVAVKADTTSAGFAVASKAETFTAYSLDIGMLIVPDEKLNTLAIKAGEVGQIRVSVERNKWYRLEGLEITADGTDVLPGAGGTEQNELEGPYLVDGEHYYRAKITGIVKVNLDKLVTEVKYQLYNPGQVGFVKTAQTVKENVGTVKIPIERKNGKSSEVRVHVTLDEEKSTNYRYIDKPDEFRFENPDSVTNAFYVWKDGSLGVTNHLVTIKDDSRYDGDFGPFTLVFKLTMDTGDGRAEIVNDTFTLTVSENDRKSAGKVVFAGVEYGYFAKSATVYTKASQPVTLDIARRDGSEAIVTGEVQAVVGKVTYPVVPSQFDWGYHQEELKQVTVSGFADATGKTVKVSFKNLKGGLKTGSPSSVSIVVIPDDAPEFESPLYTDKVNRYVDVGSKLYYPIRWPSAPKDFTLSFTKLSGTLPAGLKVSADPANTAMLVTGIPSKAGVYTACYQVTATVKNGKKTVKIPGLVTAITIIVKDPAVKEGEKEPVNASCVKSRSLTDMMVISEESRRLGGLMNLTIPANTGKVSAKYICASGTVSFSSAKSWSELRDGSNFVARLVPSNKKYAGYAIEIEAYPNYWIKAKVTDPAFKEPLVSAHYGLTWKDLAKTYPEYFGTGAKDWEGSYTVALPWEETVYEQTNGYASTGTATLTLKLTDKTNGKMSWGLTLPNGTTASGSSTLAPTEYDYPIPTREPQEVAFLPVFKTTATERFASVLAVLRGAKEDAENNVWRAGVLGATNWVDACWTHMAPAKAESSNVGFETIHGVWGGAYLGKGEDLGGCCSKFYNTNSLAFYVDCESITSLVYQAFGTAENPIARIKVGASTMSVDTSAGNPQKLKLSFTSSTGVVKGSFNLQYEKTPGVFKDLSVSYSGVVLPGWGGEWCGCIDDIVTPITLPFVNGSWYFTDKVPYKKLSGKKTVDATLSDKRGAAFWVDPLPQN